MWDRTAEMLAIRRANLLFAWTALLAITCAACSANVASIAPCLPAAASPGETITESALGIELLNFYKTVVEYSDSGSIENESNIDGSGIYFRREDGKNILRLDHIRPLTPLGDGRPDVTSLALTWPQGGTLDAVSEQNLGHFRYLSVAPPNPIIDLLRGIKPSLSKCGDEMKYDVIRSTPSAHALIHYVGTCEGTIVNIGRRLSDGFLTEVTWTTLGPKTTVRSDGAPNAQCWDKRCGGYTSQRTAILLYSRH